MELQLFDSLTNKVNHLSVSPEKSVNIYLCGPTVYNHIHCGNLRPVIIFDILHRLLLALNIKVDYTQNITDIDDKIIRQAKKEKVSEKKIAVHYTKSYLANLVNYNVLFPHNFPRVSNYIFSIQKFIKQLVKKNYAYQSRGEVLFHTGINKSYGKLSGQNLEKLQVNSREIVAADKNDRKDFVL
jgi:cysteinyl-tRNA synthetase